MESINKLLNDVIFNAIRVLDTLRQKIHKDISKLKKSQPNLDNDDIRIYFFIQIDNVLLDTAIAYKLSENLNSNDWWKNNIPDCPSEEIPKRIEIFQKSLVLNLINLTYSLTEDAFRQLIRQVKPNACNGGKSAFDNIYKCLLKELNLTYDDSLFKLFRVARNCTHNNGFYFPENNTNSENITYRNGTYHFPYAQKVQYPTGLPILKILEDIVSLYVEMVESETLKKNSKIKRANAD